MSSIFVENKEQSRDQTVIEAKWEGQTEVAQEPPIFDPKISEDKFHEQTNSEQDKREQPLTLVD